MTPSPNLEENKRTKYLIFQADKAQSIKLAALLFGEEGEVSFMWKTCSPWDHFHFGIAIGLFLKHWHQRKPETERIAPRIG